ncbi:MAG TPA: alpha/beta fold hydrolase, partial [Intrasporangiaceae bacterium]|nr:alpha/beta fold hydrolase [Intrasporangiaceae bacterium]
MPRHRLLPRLTRAAAVAGLTLSMLYAPLASAMPSPEPVVPLEIPTRESTAPDIEATPIRIPTVPEPDGAAVELDADIYVPPSGEGPFPALIVAHGFGGSKDQLSVQAQEYADAGYLVLAYTARGFGESGGQIHLMVPALEGADVSSLVDYLATRDDVRQDADNDPRVGIAGGSYGGAAALMGSALDERIDAAVALVTWNDLAQSLFAQHATTDEQPATPAALTPIDTPGVFKRLWGSRFFGAALAGGPPMSAEPTSPAEPAPETPETPEPSPPATPPAPTPPHSTNP